MYLSPSASRPMSSTDGEDESHSNEERFHLLRGFEGLTAGAEEGAAPALVDLCSQAWPSRPCLLLKTATKLLNVDVVEMELAPVCEIKYELNIFGVLLF